MYEIAEHRFGSVIIKRGPMSGCRSFDGHEWKQIGVLRKKAEAIALADASPSHATVCKRMSSEKIHDNGKQPLPRQ